MDIAKQLDRGRDDLHPLRVHRTTLRLAVRQQMYPCGGWGDALVEHAFAEQRVDEGTLPRVELADNHEEEQIVQLAE